jgi:nitrogen regulatory protein P-II 1
MASAGPIVTAKEDLMDARLIIAIIRHDKLEGVEKRLRDLGVERIDVSKVKGYGEYRNFFTQDWMGDEVRLELYTKKEKVDAIAAAIMDGAHTGSPGDGVIAVVPVEKLFVIRTRAEATPEQFWPSRDTR